MNEPQREFMPLYHSPDPRAHIPPLVWVEAEQLFITRGYLYRVQRRLDEDHATAQVTRGGVARPLTAAGQPADDSDLMLVHERSGRFIALSSRSHEHLQAHLPRGWAQAEPLTTVECGTCLGETIVVRRDGGNEYTVILPVSSHRDELSAYIST